MFRRLATLALSLSLATTAFTTSTASARDFARPPAAAPAAPATPAEAPRAVDEPAPPRLSATTRARLLRVLAARRARNVGAFRAYADRGRYPHNFITAGPLNVWIDQEGRMCAAATMIFHGGGKALVRRVAREDNHIKLGDVTGGPVLDWILTSGLTQAEVALIQEPFMGREIREPHEPGSPAWRVAEDERLRDRYDVILGELAVHQAANLEAAVDALAARPDLVARLLRG